MWFKGWDLKQSDPWDLKMWLANLKQFSKIFEANLWSAKLDPFP